MIDNPAFPKDEYYSAKKSMPPWRFSMLYDGLFTGPAGLIYGSFDETRQKIPRIAIPDHWQRFPRGPFHFVASTGLNEFLEEPQLEVFYRNVYDRLAPGGTLYTGCTQKERRSEVVMRAFELVTRYHTPEELKQLLGKLPWSRVDLTQDETGMQTFVVAVK